MAYCKQCGKQLPDNAMFCPNCGTQVDDSKTSNNGLTNKIRQTVSWEDAESHPTQQTSSSRQYQTFAEQRRVGREAEEAARIQIEHSIRVEQARKKLEEERKREEEERKRREAQWRFEEKQREIERQQMKLFLAEHPILKFLNSRIFGCSLYIACLLLGPLLYKWTILDVDAKGSYAVFGFILYLLILPAAFIIVAWIIFYPVDKMTKNRFNEWKQMNNK